MHARLSLAHLLFVCASFPGVSCGFLLAAIVGRGSVLSVIMCVSISLLFLQYVQVDQRLRGLASCCVIKSWKWTDRSLFVLTFPFPCILFAHLVVILSCSVHLFPGLCLVFCFSIAIRCTVCGSIVL